MGVESRVTGRRVGLGVSADSDVGSSRLKFARGLQYEFREEIE
jgi:hypothetical protein